MPIDKDNSGKNQKPTGNRFHQSETQSAQPRALSPLRSITVITEVGPIDVPIKEISTERIGWKAYGLASLPSQWVPPFFLMTASCFNGDCADETLDEWIAECFSSADMGAGRKVMVRSSGTSETMRNRGWLVSKFCSPHEVLTTIKQLMPQLPKMLQGTVHWIVQEYIDPKEKGHLSNERRLKKENRDWVVEFEPREEHRGFTEPIAVRRWRDGTDQPDLDLHCTSEFAITLRLKRVAMWATSLSSRTHFEWVWDGKAIHIVQAQVEELTTGVNPRLLLPPQVHSVEPASLHVFHLANQEDYGRYGKLRNAKLYGELGYHMPIFYVVEDSEVVKSILSGWIPPKLEADLVQLTSRPLIIRTDGTNIPADKREMLPRSEELRSQAKAINWLLTDFRSKIEEVGLGGADLCLIAHHFIPSVASAWARAVPGDRIVRIESLWGIPEGLYWHSHDTFEVDTQDVKIISGYPTTPLKYKSSKHLRHKGTFIAPDEDGKWIPYQTKPPYDWNKSIGKQEWLFEIAHTTRCIAEREKHAVDVMWFIDNHPQATEHKILPWFHSKSELIGIPKAAAPRQKRKDISDFKIKNADDWQRLRQSLESGTRIERVVIEPDDPEIIRNPIFAKELADLARSNKFVVELYGGLLSHAYYILQSRGAQVECIDLFGASEDVDDYNKVVRDKIPALIEGRGELVETVHLADDALVAALRQKLVEEAFEALDAKSGELIGELADIQEVIRALCGALGISISDIETEREEKEKRRGGFNKGLMLIKTATPHSIQKHSTPSQKHSTPPEPPALELRSAEPAGSIISDVADIPTKRLYRRPDLRQVNQQFEKMFTFETETNKLGEVIAALNFSMPINNQGQQDFNLTIELRRTRSSIRGVVRLRLLPTQLQLEFPE